MSIFIGIAVVVDWRPPVIWQKIKGQKLMLKEAGFKRFASWEFDERLMAGRPLVIGRDVSLWTSSRDGSPIKMSVDDVAEKLPHWWDDMSPILFDEDGEVMDEDYEQDDEEVPA